jgi:hypothetical protein
MKAVTSYDDTIRKHWAIADLYVLARQDYWAMLSTAFKANDPSLNQLSVWSNYLQLDLKSGPIPN